MIVLKQVIKYPNANAIEATWVNHIITPAVGQEGQEGYKPAQISEQVVRCHAYSDAQMDELEADIGEEAASEYSDLIAEVRANIQPPAPPAPPLVPASVTMRQARLELLAADKLDDVEAAISSIPDVTARKAARIEWEYSNEVLRHNGFVSQIAPMLGLNEAALDAMFIQAAAR
jgi:hypothetical protein